MNGRQILLMTLIMGIKLPLPRPLGNGTVEWIRKVHPPMLTVKWVCLLVLSLFVYVSSSAYSQETSTIPGASTAQTSPTIMRDPTKPFTGKVEVSGQLQLSSILIGKERRLALINDTFVQIGDTIGSAKVIAIKEDSVVLLDSGRTETLYLFTNDIRK